MMRTALEYASGLSHLADGFEVVLAQHCEVDALAAGGAMHEGEWSSRLGMPGQPAEAEELMIARDLALARLTDGRVFPARHHGPWRRSDPSGEGRGTQGHR